MQFIELPDGTFYAKLPNGQMQRFTRQQAQQIMALQAQQSQPQQPSMASGLGEGFKKGIEEAMKSEAIGETSSSLGGETVASEALPAFGELAEVPALETPAFGLEGAGASESLGATAPAEAGMFDLGGIGSAGNVILPAIGAYGAYNLAASQGEAPSGGRRNMRGAIQGGASGAAMGSYFGAPGAIIGGVIGTVAGLTGSLTGSSKGGRQMTRDSWRDELLQKRTELFDENYQGTLADGTTKFDWGRDKFGFGKGEGDIDLSKDTVTKAIQYGSALSGIQGYGGGKEGEAITTQYVQAATANTKDDKDINTVKNNYRDFFSKLGIKDRETARKALDQASASGNMTEQEWQIKGNFIDELFSGTANTTGFDKNGKWIGVKK